MKFVVGMLVGLGAGVAAAMLMANRSDEEGLATTVQTNVQKVLHAAKSAATQREKELWREFHERVPAPDQATLG